MVSAEVKEEYMTLQGIQTYCSQLTSQNTKTIKSHLSLTLMRVKLVLTIIGKSTDMWIRGQLRSQEIILSKPYENSVCYNLVTRIDLFTEINYKQDQKWSIDAIRRLDA